MAEISGENGAVYWNEGLRDTVLPNSIKFTTGTSGLTDQHIISCFGIKVANPFCGTLG
ncbi:hypothetical protein ES708_16129 [subsurface metagenome]